MPELRRYRGNNTILISAGILLALALVVGFLVLGARAGESGSTDKVPGPALPPSAVPEGPGLPKPPGSSGGAGSAGVGATFDSDQSVSSEDPPPPVRTKPSPPNDGIDSFEDCANAGYPIAESYPEQCFTPDGRGFTRQLGR